MSNRRQEELIKMLRMYTHLLHLNKPTIQIKQNNLDALIKLQMQLFKKMKK
jgi:hypothetical protein